MGNKIISNVLKTIILLLFITTNFSCGEFIGFSSLPEPDLGTTKVIRLYLSPESLLKLYNTVKNPTYVPCFYEENEIKREARIKIRGLSTKIYPKKSFTVKLVENGQIVRYCLKDFSLKNRLAFAAYKKVGLGAPDTEGIGLFINDEYIGCYTKIKLYNQYDLEHIYGPNPGQLFKCHFKEMGSDIPLHYWSEKKFPDDNDFSLLNKIIYNAKNMNNKEWFQWVDDHIDKDEIVKYMIVHDFLGVIDTHYQNFYIYVHSLYLLLPWDNELGIDINHLPSSIGGNNILTSRLLQDPYMRSQYNYWMEEYFLKPGEQNIIQDIIDELIAMCDEIDRAVFHDPTYYIDYSTFLQTRDQLEHFVQMRPGTISIPPLP